MKASTPLHFILAFYYVLFFLCASAQQYPNSQQPYSPESYFVIEVGRDSEGKKIFQYVPLLDSERYHIVNEIYSNEWFAYQAQFNQGPELTQEGVYYPLNSGSYVEVTDYEERGNFIIDPAALSTIIPENKQEVVTEIIPVKNASKKDNLERAEQSITVQAHQKKSKSDRKVERKTEKLKKNLQSLGSVSIERIKIFLDNHKSFIVDSAKKGEYLAKVALGQALPKGERSHEEAWAIALRCYETKDFDQLAEYQQFCSEDIVKCIEQAFIQAEFLSIMDQKKFDQALEIKKKIDINHIYLKPRIFEEYSALLQYEEKKNKVVPVNKQKDVKKKKKVITVSKDINSKNEKPKQSKNNGNEIKTKTNIPTNTASKSKEKRELTKSGKSNQKPQELVKSKGENKKKNSAQLKIHKKIQSDYNEIVNCKSTKEVKKLVEEFISKYGNEKSIDEIVPLTILKTGVISDNNLSSVLFVALWIYCKINNCYEKILCYKEKLPEGIKKNLREVEARYVKGLKRISEGNNQESIIKFIKDYRSFLKNDNSEKAQLLLSTITQSGIVDAILAEKINWDDKIAKMEKLNCYGKQLRSYRDFCVTRCYPFEPKYYDNIQEKLKIIDYSLLDDKNRRIALWFLGQVTLLQQNNNLVQKFVDESCSLDFLLRALFGRHDYTLPYREDTCKAFEELLEQKVRSVIIDIDLHREKSICIGDTVPLITYTDNQLAWMYLYVRFYWHDKNNKKNCSKLIDLLIDRNYYPALLFLGNELQKSIEPFRYCALSIILSKLGENTLKKEMRDSTLELALFKNVKNIIAQMPGTLILLISALKWANDLYKDEELVECVKNKSIACSSTEFHYLIQTYMTLVSSDKPLLGDGLSILKNHKSDLSQYLHKVVSLYIYAAQFYVKIELNSIMKQEDKNIDDQDTNMLNLNALLTRWVKERKLNNNYGIDYQFSALLDDHVDKAFRTYLTEWLQQRNKFDSRYKDHIDQLFCLVIEKYLNFDDYDMSIVESIRDRQAFHKIDIMNDNEVGTWDDIKKLLEITLKSRVPKIWYASHINLGYFITHLEKIASQEIEKAKKTSSKLANSSIIFEVKKAREYSREIIADTTMPVMILYNTIASSTKAFFHNLLNEDLVFNDYFLMLDSNLHNGLNYEESIKMCNIYNQGHEYMEKLCKLSTELLLTLDSIKKDSTLTNIQSCIDEKKIENLLIYILNVISIDPNNGFLAFKILDRIYCMLFCYNEIYGESKEVIANKALAEIVFKWASAHKLPLIMPRIMKYIETNEIYKDNVFVVLREFLKYQK